METAEIARLYTLEHRTMQQIATLAGVSKVAIWKRLRKAGVSATQGEQVTRPCLRCGRPVVRPRCHAKSRRIFCSGAHYYAFLSSSGYQHSRHGQRLARKVVSAFFTLQPGHVVHHHSGNERNNRPSNLAVFASQAEHMRFHRGGDATPLWDGRYRHATPFAGKNSSAE